MFATCVNIVVLFVIVKSAKILVVAPTPIISHQVIFRPLIQGLINRDHEVIVITTDPVYSQGESPKNLKEIDLHNVSYTAWRKTVYGLINPDQSDLSKTKDALNWLSEIFMEQIKDKSVQKIIGDQSTKFDLLIVETCVPASLIFYELFRAPVIYMSTLGALPGNMKTIGSVMHPLLYPSHYQQKLYNLTVWEKICAVLTDVAYNTVCEMRELEDDKRIKNIFEANVPNLNQIKNNVHMLFLNIHPIWLHNQPIAPNVVFTWGVRKPIKTKLSKDLQYYLDASKRGVIYISFGSVFSTSEFSPDVLETFVKVFSRLPYDILWKWDDDEVPGKLENIKVSKWLPQYDVLSHPNLKLFITHGGLQSTNEAIDAGMPLIGIPQFGDQEYNTEKYEYFKIGTKLNLKSMTVETLENAIKTIFENYDSYKKNIVQLRTLMNDRPQPVLEHVIWRIEYLLRHGGTQHLRAPAANMSWIEYYELEIVMLMLSGLVFLSTALLVLVYICLRSILRFIKFKVRTSKVSSKYY